jgi:hypothetical protein
MKIELDINEVNYVLQALMQRPYGEVATLIQNVKAQADKALIAQTNAEQNEIKTAAKKAAA